MANWYFNNAADTSFLNVNNWWSNANGTGTHPAAAPWTTSATQADNLLPATGFSDLALYFPNASGEENPIKLGDGLTITGTCSVNIVMTNSDEDPPFGAIIGGNYTALILGGFIYGGSFVNITQSIIYNGTFSGAINGSTIQGGLFSSTASVSDGSSISGGTFNCSLQRSVAAGTTGGVFNAPVDLVGGGLTGGTFNSTFSQSNSNVSGGTFNGAYTQNSGNISGGTFNGTYSRTSGNVTGGTFNNGILNQFYRNGFPPPLVFGGYNPNALDVLGTGML